LRSPEMARSASHLTVAIQLEKNCYEVRHNYT